MVLLSGAQRVVVSDNEIGLSVVAQNRLVAIQSFAIVHYSVTRAATPERSRSQLVPGRLAAVLDDAITRSDIVKQEVAERVNDLVAESCRNDECSAVDR